MQWIDNDSFSGSNCNIQDSTLDDAEVRKPLKFVMDKLHNYVNKNCIYYDKSQCTTQSSFSE